MTRVMLTTGLRMNLFISDACESILIPQYAILNDLTIVL